MIILLYCACQKDEAIKEVQQPGPVAKPDTISGYYTCSDTFYHQHVVMQSIVTDHYDSLRIILVSYNPDSNDVTFLWSTYKFSNGYTYHRYGMGGATMWWYEDVSLVGDSLFFSYSFNAPLLSEIQYRRIRGKRIR